MKKVIVAFVILVSGLAQAQGKFEEGMGKAFSLWKEGKSKEASDLFERIAAAEKRQLVAELLCGDGKHHFFVRNER